jgi:hypothetical protein
VPTANLGNEWMPGTRLVVLRRGYRHHGIYAGQGRVIHYAGLGRYPRGRIEEVPIEDFVRDRPIRIGAAPDQARGLDIVQRARSRLGERQYDLLNNNCEHFCNWCLRGESRSLQIESLTRPIRLLAHMAATLLTGLSPHVDIVMSSCSAESGKQAQLNPVQEQQEMLMSPLTTGVP